MADRILIVDDEREITDLVALYLENENYTVYKCYSAQEAVKYIESETLDLAILDVMLLGMSGLDICRKIREKYCYPVIMLTAKDGEIDKITGLTLGADDYITKPFLPLELVARVKAQLRRYKKYALTGGTCFKDNVNSGMISGDHSKKYGKEMDEEEEIFVHLGLVLNVKAHECTLNEKPLSLTPTEFSILEILCRKKGNVVSSEEIFHQVWGDEYFSKSNNTITVHIRHLREKMGDSFEKPKFIKTVWGCGYKIEG